MHSSIDITSSLVIPLLLSLPAAGAGVYIAAEILKKIFGMNSGKAIHTMVVLLSIVGAVVPYLIKFKGLPIELLGITSPAAYGFSQAIYKAAVYISDHGYLSKVSNLLYKVSSLLSSKPASTPAADAGVAAVTVPEAPSKPVTPQEFSL